MLNNIWQDFLNIVNQEVGSRVVDTWFKAVTLVKWDFLQKTIYVQAPNSFVRDWIKSHYLNLFSLHLSRLFNVSEINIVFVDSEQKQLETNQKVENITQSDSQNVQVSPSTKINAENKLPIKGAIRDRSQVNTNYQFTTFVVGPNNSLAYAAAYAVTQKPGILYNPLFIYGGSGLGKTHLLHAIGNEIKSKNKDAVILYQTSDRFVTEFINAIRFDKIHFFKEKYKAIDVLLVDDIQFFSNKDQTQEAFFHIFNSLYDSHQQIVFSSDNYPKHIEGIAERLRSRLEWGLVTDIHAPTLETKIAILKKKIEGNTENISDEVFHFIASRVNSNIRELEGSLIRVLAFSNLTNQPVSLETAKKVLSHTNEQKNNNIITFSQISKAVCKSYSYNLNDLQSKNKNKELSLARQITMYFMKRLTDKSLQEIGFFLKRKDHSTVLHAINKIETLRKSDEEFNTTLKKIEEEINN